MNNDIEFEVIKDIAAISENGNYSKRLRVVSYDGKPGKLEVRAWRNGKNGETPLKGITLTDEEAKALMEALAQYFIAS